MCGIMGYIGKKNSIPIVIDGLKRLEYRGYDSSGIAFFKNNQIKIIKEKGRISELEKLIDQDKSNICIGHTRWATHGKPSKINAHPHSVGNITIVHNGIIENYHELKDKLIKEGYVFKSDTDTEIACGVIDYLYNKTKDEIKTINELKKVLKGSYAFLILFKNSKKIYAIRHGSPLIIASNQDGNYIASDIPAILPYTKEYYLLDEDEMCIIDDSITFMHDGKVSKKEKLVYNYDILVSSKSGYKRNI